MRQFYYHITTKAWPDELTLSPRKYGVNRGEDEPNISRICVAPTVEGCLTALGSCLTGSSNIYIYRTVRKVKAIKPNSVVDAKITGEMWLLRPIKFKYIDTIKKNTLPEYLFWMQAGIEETLHEQKNIKRLLKRNMKKYL